MRSSTALIAAALFAAPVPVLAQGGDVSEIEVSDDGNDDEGNSRIGLLGLLGLAGLLGLRRREPDIHVDARGDGRP